MKIRILIKPVQPATLRNLTTHPIITNIKELQKIHCFQPLRKLPVDHIVIHIQRYQASGELHFAHVKGQHVPRFVRPEKHGRVSHQFVPLQLDPARVYVRKGRRDFPRKLVVR